ncbi:MULTISPECIES: DUF6266 family protein [Olivibacter]|uniref:DUF6266 family protein n=1 Tax=Olivibacter jilunii TaxID=985016 RepID=A0ABW6B5F8_9SPHI|nr:DUF6266 family protein [Pseudosphingobacterium sp.]
MARFINMTTFSGTFGNMVGCLGPFGFYIRSKPKKSLKPPSQKQLTIRAKMALVGAYLQPLKEMVYLGFAASYRVKSRTAAMNMAVGHAMRNAIGGSYPDLYIRPEEVIISQGKVPNILDAELSVEEKRLVLSWRWWPSLNSFADDRVYLMAYHVAARSMAMEEAFRDTESISINLEAEPPGSTLQVYVCVSRRDNKFFSDSRYMGAFLV